MNADVPVREVVDREYLGVSESDSLLDTAELLLEREAAVALVLRGTEPVGVVSERDILGYIVNGADPGAATAGDAMSQAGPVIDPDEPLPRAIDRVSADSKRHVIVRSNGDDDPLGLLTEHDLLASTIYDASADSSPEAPSGSGTARQSANAEAPAYEEQGICERCGTLAHELAVHNGELLCTDCRAM